MGFSNILFALLAILFLTAHEAAAHCYNLQVPFQCKKARRCYWGSGGCSAQRNKSDPDATVLSHFRDKK